ncbi:MAG TPA: hypothetical protein VFQ39_05505, partial [Longimicrobium sp.]|nr:hypothetical protein [Longimicrobium sp.]
MNETAIASAPAAPAAREVLTAAEERFERLRRRVGMVAAPLAFAALLIAPLGGLKPEAHRLAAVMAAVVILWI